MMNYLNSICLLLFLSTCSVFSQEFTSWSQQLEKLDSITDPNKKRFELKELNASLNSLWADREIKQDNNTKLQLFSSEDKKVNVACFGAETYKGIYQLEWLVKYNNRVWSFREEFNFQEAKTSPQLKYSLSTYQEDIYSFEVKNGKKTLINSVDLLSKCLFEDFELLQTDIEKDSLNKIIQKRMVRLWSNEDMFDHSFANLKRMRTLHSDDGKVKVCTYNILKAEFNQVFYGAVILKDGGINVVVLNDDSREIRSPERSTLTAKKWYGALYYDIIETSSGSKTYYTLLGYKGHDEFMKTRVIDVMQVQNNRLRFGAPIFKNDRISRNRDIFQYSAKATMMLRYDAKLKMIVFDNLEPSDPMFRTVYQYYGPDFSYNAYKFTGGVWEFKKDIDLRNPKP